MSTRQTETRKVVPLKLRALSRTEILSTTTTATAATATTTATTTTATTTNTNTNTNTITYMDTNTNTNNDNDSNDNNNNNGVLSLRGEIPQHTPSSQSKIRVFSDPTLGRS